MNAVDLDAQKVVLLTASPFQRVGAFSLAGIGQVDGPAALTPELFDAVVRRMADDALRAARVSDTKADDGFWLKTSGSFFPNSKMNHPSRQSKMELLADEVGRWRSMPEPGAWPDAPCALCSRQAVAFYGKVDIALAESISVRNTTPRGHGGLGLCWPCVCCFHALPYGCVLTGGSSSALHSLQDDFVRQMVFRQVELNHQHITLGVPVAKRRYSREAAALLRMRHYTERLRAGVDLMIFSNSNREQTLDIHRLDQPIAEWLRASMRPKQRQGFTELVRAHRTRTTLGIDALARNAFRRPEAILGGVAGYLSATFEATRVIPEKVTDLARVCRPLVEGVLGVNDEDVKQIETLAHNLALMITADTASGPLTGLLRSAKRPADLQRDLQTRSAKWLVAPPDGAAGPLLTTRQFRLLFDPDSQSWLHRQLLTIAVMQALSEQGWRPGDAKAVADKFDEDMQALEAIDVAVISEDGEEA